MSTLIADQITATAVTDALTTLIDWVNIEDYAAFHLIIENTGGGTGDPITDVQVDESSDGGTTVLLDQHAGLPAVPITAAESSHGTTAAIANSTTTHFRVRAVCGAGDDTTAKAWLTADTVTGHLCSLTDMRERLGYESGDTNDDSALRRMILSIDSLFDSVSQRTFLLNAADVTEYYDGGMEIYLQRYPVVNITSVLVANDWDWASATALTADTEYHLQSDFGILYYINALGGWWGASVGSNDWPDGVQNIRVIYQGGYVGANDTPGAGETAVPNDLREAAIEQVSFILKRRDDIGLTAVSAQGTSVTKFSAMDLLPSVRDTLARYRR